MELHTEHEGERGRDLGHRAQHDPEQEQGDDEDDHVQPFRRLSTST
ncbi:hypothetical protein [Streptomyces sp. NBC_01238]